MLLNPFTTKLPTLPGTRMLADSLGLSGYVLQDPKDGWRVWTIQWLFSPIKGRSLGGIRARLLDQYGFTTFCNQKDLEVMLGCGVPGKRCPWTAGTYSEPGDCDWFGFCMDTEDLLDDLHERELRLRNGSSEVLPRSMELSRLVHLDHNEDAQELFILLQDADRRTGMAPDARLETIEGRWARVEKLPVKWG